jgi:hypothetical protein
VVENNRLIPNHQFGFRQRHSTIGQTHQIVQINEVKIGSPSELLPCGALRMLRLIHVLVSSQKRIRNKAIMYQYLLLIWTDFA